MAAQITDTPILTAPINAAFQTNFLMRAKSLCPYFIGSKPGIINRHSGTFTISWRRIENATPTTSALTELNGNVAAPTRDSIVTSTTNVQATLSKYGQFMVVNEEANLLNFNGQTQELVDVLATSGGRSLNMLQRNELEDNATAIYAAGATAATGVTNKLSRDDIRNAVNVLNRNVAKPFTPMTTGSQNVGTSPMRPSFWGITHPDVEEDIRDMSGFIAAESYAGQTQLATGEFGAVAGVRFIVSSDATVDAEGGGTSTGTGLRTSGNSKVDIYPTVILGMEAHGSVSLDTAHVQEVYRAGDPLPGMQLIRTEFGSGGSYDPFQELMTIAWKSWHAPKILNSAWVRTVYSGASLLT